MFSAIKSEARKLLTVRSTYLIFAISLLIVMFFAGFVEGFRGNAASLAQPFVLSSESTNNIIFVGLILAFAGLLLAGHEYRYNTIAYTLTSVNRRYKVIIAKVLVITAFAVVTSAIVTFFAPLCTIVGAHLAGKDIGPQIFDTWQLLWRCVFCGWGYAMYAFVLLMILRSQIGAIVTFLLVPLIGENILVVLLKENAKNLPFRALQSVPAPMDLPTDDISNHGVIVVLIYVAIGLVISTILFVRRDAN